MTQASLLIEIGVEELPAASIEPALHWLGGALAKALAAEGLGEQLEVEGLATPRRLTLHARGVAAQRPPVQVQKEGPRRAACFDESGAPTRALIGFARGAGVEVEAVTFVQTEKKGEVASVMAVQPGKSAAEILATLIPDLIARVPFTRSMHWVSKEQRFARPIRSLVVLLGDAAIDVEYADVKSGRATRGHPFLAPDAIPLASADLGLYRSALAAASVQPDPAARREQIRELLKGLPQRAGCPHLEVQIKEDLLAEVANLVEWPGVVVGSFDESFLEVPEAVIIEPLEVQQRYFAMRERATGKLASTFAIVHNRGASPHAAVIGEGNARVVRARLFDARFFFQNDSKSALADFLPRLSGMVYRHAQGTMLDKAKRLSLLASNFAQQQSGAAGATELATRAERAGLLAKADLATEVVSEFPRLQGVMGRIYAERSGEAPEVAAAIGRHYGPRPDQELPIDAVDVAVALADKMDNLASASLAGELATGSRDPFASRRDALAVIRILYDGESALRLDWLIEQAIVGFAGFKPKIEPAAARTALLSFFADRLAGQLKDAGHDHERVAAVLATSSFDLANVKRRLRAVDQIAATQRWQPLVEAVERTGNISRGAVAGARRAAHGAMLPAERALAEALAKTEPLFKKAVASGDYTGASAQFCDHLAAPLATFFAEVFVNSEVPAEREFRLGLLADIHALYARSIADLSLVSWKRDRRT